MNTISSLIFVCFHRKYGSVESQLMHQIICMCIFIVWHFIISREVADLMTDYLLILNIMAAVPLAKSYGYVLKIVLI